MDRVDFKHESWTRQSKTESEHFSPSAGLASTGKPVDVLLVEDNPGDVRILKEAMNAGRLLMRLSVVQDGFEALAFLRHQGQYASAPTPDLILLDLNLPRKDGREVLAEIKHDQRLGRIPVIVLTTSADEFDFLKAKNLHVSGYMRKPVDADQLLTAVRGVDGLWVALVKVAASFAVGY